MTDPRPRLAVAAPAKINLTLEVLGRRGDGYHALCTVMQAVSLRDRLRLAPASTLRLTVPGRPDLEGPHNLVWRAAELLRRELAVPAGAALTLEKRVPVQAGLGGGSADGAAALLGLNALWGLGLARAQLRELGARLGSDVPFFLGESGCALAEGRGERLTPLPPLPPCWIVLLTPPLGVSTVEVFRAFPSERWSDGGRTRAWLARAAAGHDVPPPFNDLEPVALQVAPGAAAARQALLDAGAPCAVMSGSGPTYFAVFETEAAARAVRRRLPPDAGQAHLARPADLPQAC